MRLNFSALSEIDQKSGGTGGTRGTPSNGAALSCPTTPKTRWDTVGQNAHVEDAPQELSHLSHRPKIEVGHRKPSNGAAVPRVPPVPPKKHLNEKNTEPRRPLVLVVIVDGRELTCIDPVSASPAEALEAQRQQWGARLETVRLR